MAMALKDFRYYDFRAKKSVEVHAGQEIGVDFMASNKIDPGKMARTKYIAVDADEERAVIRRPVEREIVVVPAGKGKRRKKA